MDTQTPIRIHIGLLGDRKEIDSIEAVFIELKLITGLKKAELYGKALEWISKDEKAREQFIEYLLGEKVKNQIMEIKE